MRKTININDTEVTLDNSIGWAFEYKDQFNEDIIATLMPVLSGCLSAISAIVEETGKTKDLSAKDILPVLGSDAMMDAIVKFSMLELTQIINITWALARNADPSIPEPKKWVRQFETFPLDVVLPEVGEMIISGLVSSKNLRSLEELKKALQAMKSQ
jgi:hypothetical protein